ncbi:MAG: family NAD(P)-dependent oxidoreductase [Marmoricola sp.]|jgi:NAD(P)H dehydrogenase (quinone)|nr:family NAD(P)-dependent oxidoreductase [Marmoricola sp.]
MSNDLPTLAVTGSTGELGRRVAQRLAASDVRQRLLVRDLSRVPRVDGGVPVEFTGYRDPGSATKALEGVTTLFMVSAAESADRLGEHKAFIDAAAAAGVRHVVYTSFHGAAPDSTFTLGRDHFNTEEHIRASGMEWTFLRDNFYLDFLPEMVGEDGVIRGPAGDGLVSAVSREDIAASAAAVLAEPGAHVGTTYHLTGSEALSLSTVAETISAAQDRKVSFHDETIEEAYESRRQWPAPDWQYDAWVSTYTAIRAGEVADVTHHVLTLTGRPPLTLQELLRRT